MTEVERRIERGVAMLARCYGGALPIIAGPVAALAVTALLWSSLARPERYSQPVGGTDGMWGLSKTGDFRAAYLLLSLGVVFTLICGWAVRRLGGAGDPERSRAANAILLLAMLPALGWLARAITLPSGMREPTFAAVFLAAGVAIIAGLGRLGPGVSASQISRLGAMQLLIAFLAMMSALGLLTCIGRTRSGAWALHDVLDTMPLAVVGLAVATMLLMQSRGIAADELEFKVRRLLLWVQAPLPLLYFVVVPPITFGSAGDVYSEYSYRLPICVSLVAIAATISWYRTWRDSRQETLEPGTSFSSYLAPLSLCGIAIFMAMQTYGVPTLPKDDYHFGEFMLPWEQWRDFHKLPYVGLYPPHGFHSVFCGLLNSTFFDGSYVGMAAADALCGALIAGATFGVAWAAAGPAPAIALSLCALSPERQIGLFGGPQLRLIVPILLALSLPALCRRNVLWLGVWVVLCAAAIAYNPQSGIAVGVSSFPFACFIAVRAIKHERKNFAAALTIALAGGCALFWLTPLGAMAKGMIGFILDNMQGYMLGSGVAAMMGWKFVNPSVLPVGSIFGFELLRSGWIVAIAVSVALLLRELGAPPQQRRWNFCVLILMMVPTAIILSRYTLARIDPGTWSRSGTMTFAFVAQLFPILLLAKADWWRGAVIAAVLASLVSALDLAPLLTDGSGPLTQRAIQLRKFADSQFIVHGPQIGMPLIGTCAADPDSFESYLTLRRAIDEYLRPDETFYALCNRNVLYTYLHRPVPVPYSVVYYASPQLLQKRILDGLDKHPVPLAVLAPAIEFDLPTNLQAYDVVRKFLLHYLAVKRGTWTLLVDPARVSNADRDTIGSERQLRLLDQAMASGRQQLLGISATWGDSWEAMRDHFDTVADLAPDSSVSGSSQEIPGPRTFNTASLRLAGKDADFLLVHIRLAATAPDSNPQLAVAWRSLPGAKPTVEQYMIIPPLNPDGSDPTATDVETTLLVPLGLWPRWLLCPGIDEIQLGVANPESVRSYTITMARLVRLRQPG